MPITMQCQACQRRYKADDRMAGKKVKCRNCGAIIHVPQVHPETETDLSLLTGLEMTPADVSGESTIVREVGPNKTRMERPTNGVEEFDIAGVKRLRPNRPFDFPFAEQLDDWLPRILIAGCTLWAILHAASTDSAAQAWLPYVRVAIAVFLFWVVIVPISSYGVSQAAHNALWSLPPSPRWRAAACFIVPTTLGYVLWLTGGGLGDFILGAVIGVGIACALLWLLFHLKIEELPKSLGISVGAYAAALAFAGFIIFGLNLVVLNALASAKQAHHLAGSPFGAPLRWVSPSETPAPAPQPKAKPTVVEKPVEPPPQPTAPVAPQEPAPATPPAVEAAPAPAAPAAPQAQPEFPVVDANELAPDPFPLATITPLPIGTVDDVVVPSMSSPWVAVVRRPSPEEDRIERWNLRPAQQSGGVTFRHNPGERGQYALSPSGEFLVRIASWPRLSAQIWSFAASKIIGNIPLDEDAGSTALLGFSTADRFVIFRNHPDGRCGIEICEVSNLQRVRAADIAGLAGYDPQLLNVACFASEPRSGRSGQARLAVLTAPPTPTGRPEIRVYDLLDSKLPFRSLPITQLNPRWLVRPSAIAFSRDGIRLAAVFENSGNALVLSWIIDSEKPLKAHVKPAGLLPDSANPLNGRRAVSWLSDSSAWLIDGDGILDVASGEPVGEVFTDYTRQQLRIHAPQPVINQWPLDDQSWLVLFHSASGQQLAELVLNGDNLDRARKAPTAPAATAP